MFRQSLKVKRFSDSKWHDTRRLKKDGVLDLKELSYTPVQKLQFVNEKCLIYLNKQRWITRWYLSSPITISMATLGYLMYTNPFYLTFPAAMPLMWLGQLILLWRYFMKLKLYKPIVESISLLRNGEVIEVVYANKLTRKLKGLPLTEQFWITLMRPAEITDIDLPILHENFPEDPKEIEKPGLFDYAWIKFYSNFDNHLMIPRRYDYANMEVLAQIFKGKVINT